MRLSQASILCMRELFRTVVNDGDISEEQRAGPYPISTGYVFRLPELLPSEVRLPETVRVGTIAGFGQTLQPK